MQDRKRELKSRGPERTKKSKRKETPKIYGSNEEAKRKPGQEGPPASSAPSLHPTETRGLLICHLSPVSRVFRTGRPLGIPRGPHRGLEAELGACALSSNHPYGQAGSALI